ncbi:hypothetical protein GCM10025779_29160 [Arthrobacter cryoconiti]
MWRAGLFWRGAVAAIDCLAAKWAKSRSMTDVPRGPAPTITTDVPPKVSTP